jgi:phage-related protein
VSSTLYAGCTRTTVTRSALPREQVNAQASASRPRSEGDPLFGAMPKLLEAINSARQRRGVPSLRVDRGLALVAQEAGNEYQRLGRGFEQRIATRTNANLRSFSLTFARVTAVVVFVERLEQAEAALTPALDPEMHFVGLSVLSGPQPSTQEGGYAVVVTLGR